MKNIFLRFNASAKRLKVTALLTFIWWSAFGQSLGNGFAISNLHLSHNAVSKEILVIYDLLGGQENSYNIGLTIYRADSTAVPAEFYKVSGDIGSDILVGTGKQLRIFYTAPVLEHELVTISLKRNGGGQSRAISLIEACQLKNIEKNINLIAQHRYFETNKKALKKIKKRIRKEFVQNGLAIEEQEFSYKGYKAHNIIGKIQGKSHPDEIIVVGAHYDATEGSTGADDNASGVAGLLEAMRVLAAYEFDRSIHFVAFDLEEESYLGSQKYVEEMTKCSGLKIHAMINLDMIGFKSEKYRSQAFPGALKTIFPEAYQEVSNDDFKGNFILNLTNESSKEIAAVFQKNAKLVPELKVLTLNVPDEGKFAPSAFRASDHVSFWEAGIKAISLGDTGDARNFYYHTGRDEIVTLDIKFATQVVKAVTATIAEIAEVE